MKDFSEVAENVSEVGWDTQATILKEDNYEGVTKLILDYYHKAGLIK